MWLIIIETLVLILLIAGENQQPWYSHTVGQEPNWEEVGVVVSQQYSKQSV